MDSYEVERMISAEVSSQVSDLRYDMEQKIRDAEREVDELRSLIRGLDERLGILESEVGKKYDRI
jgi:hypothetical protein